MPSPKSLALRSRLGGEAWCWQCRRRVPKMGRVKVNQKTVIPAGAERSEAKRRDLLLCRQDEVPRLRRPWGGSARDDGEGEQA
jgi:hypothetical protein